MKKLIFILVACSLSALGQTFVSQAGGAGANCGADGTQTAISAATFNSGTTCGTTYKLCGTFSGANNAATILTPPTCSGGSGTSYTIQAESNTDIKADYFNSSTCGVNFSGINANGNSIVFDGNGTGIIENTNAGSDLTYKSNSGSFNTCLVLITSSKNVEVKSWTIQNTYQNVVHQCYLQTVALTSNVLTGTCTTNHNFVTGDYLVIGGLYPDPGSLNGTSGTSLQLASASGSTFTANLTHADIASYTTGCAVTNLSLASNFVTVTCPNGFVVNDTITFSGISPDTIGLNGQTVQVCNLSGSGPNCPNPTGTQFTAAFTHANVASFAATGSALRGTVGGNDDARGSYGIWITGTASGHSIHNNTITNSRAGVFGDFSGGTHSNILIYSNVFTKHPWGAIYASGSNSFNASVDEHANTFSSRENWFCPAANSAHTCGYSAPDLYHTDDFFHYSTAGGTGNAEFHIYKNKHTGDMGVGATAFDTCTTSGSTLAAGTHCYITREILDMTGAPTRAGVAAIALSVNTSGHVVANNTILGTINTAGECITPSQGGLVYKNNICEHFNRAYFSSSTLTPSVAITSQDNNVFNDISSGVLANTWFTFGSNTYTWTGVKAWQTSFPAFDVHSSTAAVTLDANYVPSGNSSGGNLSSYCQNGSVPYLPELCTDYNGNSVINWYQGAVQGVQVAPYALILSCSAGGGSGHLDSGDGFVVTNCAAGVRTSCGGTHGVAVTPDDGLSCTSTAQYAAAASVNVTNAPAGSIFTQFSSPPCSSASSCNTLTFSTNDIQVQGGFQLAIGATLTCPNGCATNLGVPITLTSALTNISNIAGSGWAIIDPNGTTLLSCVYPFNGVTCPITGKTSALLVTVPGTYTLFGISPGTATGATTLTIYADSPADLGGALVQ